MVNNIRNSDIHELASFWEASSLNVTFRNTIEASLKQKIAANQAFSREWLFNHRSKALTIHFVPTTNAYSIYGHYAVVSLDYDELTYRELTSNITSIPPINTSGRVKGLVLVKNSLIEADEEISFVTNEILSVEHI